VPMKTARQSARPTVRSVTGLSVLTTSKYTTLVLWPRKTARTMYEHCWTSLNSYSGTQLLSSLDICQTCIEPNLSYSIFLYIHIASLDTCQTSIAPVSICIFKNIITSLDTCQTSITHRCQFVFFLNNITSLDACQTYIYRINIFFCLTCTIICKKCEENQLLAMLQTNFFK
jgi:hypothetical protein